MRKKSKNQEEVRAESKEEINKKFIRIFKLAAEVVLKEDEKLFKELAKY